MCRLYHSEARVCADCDVTRGVQTTFFITFINAAKNKDREIPAGIIEND